jgi:hypothetical protein
MQDKETFVDQITDVARSFVYTVTCAEIIFAAFREVSRYLPSRGLPPSPRIADEGTHDFGLQFPLASHDRLVIRSRSVEI